MFKNKKFLNILCLLGIGEIFQNGQTELRKPAHGLSQDTRRRTWVRREAKFVRSKKASKSRKIE